MADKPIKPRRSRADRALAQRMLELLRQGKDVRRRKVGRIKSAIRNRSYENELKLEICVDRLLKELSDPTSGRTY